MKSRPWPAWSSAPARERQAQCRARNRHDGKHSTARLPGAAKWSFSSAPGFAEFGLNGSAFTLEGSPKVSATLEGELKFLGYDAQALINVKNP